MRVFPLLVFLLGLFLLTAAVPLPAHLNSRVHLVAAGNGDSNQDSLVFKCTQNGEKVLCVVQEDLSADIHDMNLELLKADQQSPIEEQLKKKEASNTSMEDYVQGCEVNEATSYEANETTYNEDRRKRAANEEEEEDVAESESEPLEKDLAADKLKATLMVEELPDSREEMTLVELTELEDDSNDRDRRSAEDSKDSKSDSKSNENSKEDNIKKKQNAIASASGDAAKAPEAAPAAVPEAAPAAVPEVAPAVLPEVAPAVLPEVAPAVLPEVAPAAVPEVAPAVSPEVVVAEAQPAVTAAEEAA